MSKSNRPRLTLVDIERELAELSRRRDDLDRAIARLQRICTWLRRHKLHREVRARQRAESQSLTNHCRAALRVAAQGGATPVEVRQALENVGFDFRRFVNPMAAVHTVLKRLVTQGEAMVRTGADGERRFAARRVGVIALTQQEATDEAFMRQLLESPSPELLVQLVSSRRRGK